MSEKMIIYPDKGQLEQKTVTLTGYWWQNGLGDDPLFRSVSDNYDFVLQKLKTHVRCNCGNIYKANEFCQNCSSRRGREKLAKMPTAPWNGNMVAYSDDGFAGDLYTAVDYYFDSCIIDLSRVPENPSDYAELVKEYFRENPVMIFNTEIDPPRICVEDTLDEIYDHSDTDYTISSELQEAVDKVNKILEGYGLYYPLDERIDPDQVAEAYVSSLSFEKYMELYNEGIDRQ